MFNIGWASGEPWRLLSIILFEVGDETSSVDDFLTIFEFVFLKFVIGLYTYL